MKPDEKETKVITEDPYAYNSVALKKEKPDYLPNQSETEMIVNPTYNFLGKFLGVDTTRDWHANFNKVYAITEWAKHESGLENKAELADWISTRAKELPSVGESNLNNLYMFARMYLNKK